VASPSDISLPLWAQILDDLRQRLASGEFTQRFPGDADLVAHYGVSRHTVREAVRRLQAEGVVERRRGSGTFLSETKIEQPVGTLYSLFRSIEEAGIAQDSVVLCLEERHDDEASQMLACPGRSLVYLERVRLAGGEPIALDWSWLPADLARPLLEVDFGHTALYEQLAQRCGIRLTSGWERLRPVLPAPRQRQLLALTSREPAFAIERLALRDGVPIEWRHGIVRGDRFTYVARWSDGPLDSTFEQARERP
jgi:GntR family transcriptional regulator